MGAGNDFLITLVLRPVAGPEIQLLNQRYITFLLDFSLERFVTVFPISTISTNLQAGCLLCGSDGKQSACDAGDPGLIHV